MTETHEIKPKRDAIERVLSRLSIRTLTPTGPGSGGVQELTAAEFAGMLARLGERRHVDRMTRTTAERLAFSYLEYGSAFAELVDHLDAWMRARSLTTHPDVSISGTQIRRLVYCLVRRHVYGQHRAGGRLREDLKVGNERLKQMSGLVSTVVAELIRADAVLADHLGEELARGTFRTPEP